MTIHFLSGEYIKCLPNWTGVIPQIGDKVILHFGDCYNEKKERYVVVDRIISDAHPESIKVFLEWIDKE